MLKWLAKVFNDCAKGRNNKYEFLRIGTMIGATVFIIMSVCHSLWNLPFDYLNFAGGYTAILGGSGVAIGFKNKMEGGK